MPNVCFGQRVKAAAWQPLARLAGQECNLLSGQPADGEPPSVLDVVLPPIIIVGVHPRLRHDLALHYLALHCQLDHVHAPKLCMTRPAQRANVN
jgi:hypothetical protein